MTDERIKELLVIGFEYSFLHEDWVTPLQEALGDVTFHEALLRLGRDGLGIWDIVLHMANWNENIVARIETGQVSHPSEGAWPPLPAVPDAEAWESAKARLFTSLDAVRTTIHDATVEKMEASPYGIGDILCRFIHMGYHIGQITKLREVLAAYGDEAVHPA